MSNRLKNIPYFGVGIGLRRELWEQIAKHRSEIDVLEITPEHYIDKPQEMEVLEKLSKNFPLVSHGLRLSVGTAAGLNEIYLKKLQIILEKIGAKYHSDHFTLSDIGNFSIGHLSPLWFTEEGLEIVIKNINRAENVLGAPILLENITSFFDIPEADFSEAEFIKRVLEQTSAGLLLDITNVFINSYNKKTDPYEFLQTLPMEKVVHVHLAGGKIMHGWFYDTHSETLTGPNEGVWPLLEWVTERAPIKTVIIERDSNFKKSFEDMFSADIARIRKNLARSK